MGEAKPPPFSFMKKTIIIPGIIALTLCSCSLFNFNSDSLNNSINDISSDSFASGSSLSSQENEPSSNTISSSDNSTSSSFLQDYSLFWSDEFEGSSLSSAWEPQIGDGTNYSVYRWGNNEEQYYKSENAVVKDGNLHIIAKRENASYVADNGEERTYQYTSARLRTKGKITTTYGYIEARIKLPSGTGMWPAFWMLPEENFEGKWWPTNGEIDIMEAKGRLVDRFGATVHTGTSNGQDYYKVKEYGFADGEDITSYHTYGVEWSLNGFDFYVDGLKFFTVTPTTYQGSNGLYAVSSTAPFDRPFHILLNLAVGGNYDGGRSPDENFQQAEMLIDYVRIYQKKQ